jgi:hypothetical protein
MYMNKRLFNTALVLSTLGSLLCISGQAAEAVSEVRAIDAHVQKINLSSVLELKLVKGPTASLTIRGDKEQLAHVTTVQTGDTIKIGTDIDPDHFAYGLLQAEMTLPELQELTTSSGGSCNVSGGFSGEKFLLNADGHGAINMTGDYKNLVIHSTATGVLKIQTVNSDTTELLVTGGARIIMSGQSKKLTASLNGFGSLSGKELITDAVVINNGGPGSAVVFAKNSADILIRGGGSVYIFGNPATRNVSGAGIGKAVWK